MKHVIILPDLGQTTGEARILNWQRRLGEEVESGDPLIEVETDKATMEVESYAAGYLREMLVREGDIVSAFLPIAIITDTPDEIYEKDLGRASSNIETESQEETADERLVTIRDPSEDLSCSKVKAMPAARALAREVGIELNSVVGSGPGGLISRKDVEQFLAHSRNDDDAQNSEGEPGKIISKAAKAMAGITALSAQAIPHFYVTSDLDMSAALKWRENWNAQHPDLKASVNALFVRAASKALLESPAFNIVFRDGKHEQKNPTGDTLIVVAMEERLSLVPFPNASDLPWEQFLGSLQKILKAAKKDQISTRSVHSHPLLGLSNLGMFNVKQFTAIIPPGCTGILAVGALREHLIFNEQQVAKQSVCSITLSADHRIVDGITAAKFLEKVQVHLNSL
jgi:pyruvate dehydrogenase E2 component (dihydrolipoamide acetyltransferase)